MQKLRTLFFASSFAFATSVWAVDTTSNPNSLNTYTGLPNKSSTLGEAPISAAALNELESGVIEAFTKNQCDRVNAMTGPETIPRFRPLVTAVVATCSKDHQQAERLFSNAERQAPYDELILVLHAQYLFKYNPGEATRIWGKIFVIAHNSALKKIAKDYLQGDETAGESYSIAKDWTFFGSLETSGSHEDNPTGQAASIGTRPGSYAVNNNAFAGISRSLESGNSIGGNFTVTTNTYFSAHDSDFWENDYDFPYSMRVGTNEDLIFRPLGRYSQFSDRTYEVMGGFAVTGVAYRDTYKQWVQTSIYQNHYYLDVVSPESGTNVRFEYNWEFYPENFFFRVLTFIQHVSAQEETTITPGADVPYSHNDIGTSLYFDYRYKSLTLSFYPSFSLREDDNDSTYENIFGNMVTKRRADQSVDMKFRASTALSKSLEAFFYYDWTRTYSNMGFADYLDRNYQDQTIGAGLRTFVTNY